MKSHSQQGMMIVVAIVFFGILLALSASLVGYIMVNVKAERVTIASSQALYLAEAGINKAIYQLNQDPAYSGESNTSLGSGTFTVSMVSVDSNTKRLTATAYIPDSTNPLATKTIKATATVNSAAVAFHYGIQIGDGGVTMNNGSKINGNAFSNGSITGSGIITGDATAAAGTSPNADQQWTTQNTDFTFEDANARKNAAQSFIAGTSGTLNRVSFYLKKTGSPGDLTIKILTDLSGQPSKTQVGGDGTLPASLVTSSYGWIDAGFASSPTLTAGTKYWIMLSGTITNGASYKWGSDNLDGYAGNTGKYVSNWNTGSVTWNGTGSDFNFKTYMNGAPNIINGVTVNGTARAEKIQACTVGKDAYYYSVNTCSVTGITYPATTPDPPQPMPISDAQLTEWETTAASGGVIPGPYTINGTQNLGPVKIDGDLTVNGVLYLTGPIWVNGNITFTNGSSLIVAGLLGNNGAIIIADAIGNTSASGSVMLSNNMTISGNGNPNSFPMVISTNTGSNAITMSNNGSSVILYASAGTINMINNASANQITAYALNLSNNTTVNYLSGLQNVGFADGPGGSWGFVPGSYVIVK